MSEPPGNELNGATALVRLLEAHGIEVVFGLCGDTSLPLYDALRASTIRHVLARDERHAAYMADGYARLSGRVGVCEAPSGGGLLYLLPGLAEANESSSALLAISTDVATAARGRHTLTELDQCALAAPVTRRSRSLDRAEAIGRELRAALRAITAGVPGTAHLALPHDVQRAPAPAEEIYGDPRWARFPALRPAPEPGTVEAAARILAGAERVLLVCGSGVTCSGAEEMVELLAERLGAAVATTVSGQGAIAETHPLALGVIGSNGGTAAGAAVVERADAVLFVGCRAGSVTTERWRRPAPGGARIVHCDLDPAVIGSNYRTEAALVGDARTCLEALAAALGAGVRRGGEMTAAVRAARQAKRAAFEPLAASDECPLRPERLVAALRRALPDEAVIVADPGTPCPYLSAYYEWRSAGRHFLTNRAHGALGYALAAAIGAHHARPEAPVVAVIGDGSFGMCVGELETLARLAIPVKVIVVANACFGWIKAGQHHGYSGRYFGVDFSATDHAAVARAYGLAAWRVEEPGTLDGALAEALAEPGPALVDCLCQPLHEARAPVSAWIA